MIKNIARFKTEFQETCEKKDNAGDQNLSPNKKTVQYRKRTIISSNQTIIHCVYNINYRLWDPNLIK